MDKYLFSYATASDPPIQRALIRLVEKATGQPKLKRMYVQNQRFPREGRDFLAGRGALARTRRPLRRPCACRRASDRPRRFRRQSSLWRARRDRHGVAGEQGPKPISSFSPTSCSRGRRRRRVSSFRSISQAPRKRKRPILLRAPRRALISQKAALWWFSLPARFRQRPTSLAASPPSTAAGSRSCRSSSSARRRRSCRSGSAARTAACSRSRAT